MGEVLYMTQQVRPKSEAHNYKTHRIVLTFRPGAQLSERWQWTVRFTRVYEFHGASAALDTSLKQAKQKIDSMIGRSERVG